MFVSWGWRLVVQVRRAMRVVDGGGNASRTNDSRLAARCALWRVRSVRARESREGLRAVVCWVREWGGEYRSAASLG